MPPMSRYSNKILVLRYAYCICKLIVQPIYMNYSKSNYCPNIASHNYLSLHIHAIHVRISGHFYQLINQQLSESCHRIKMFVTQTTLLYVRIEHETKTRN